MTYSLLQPVLWLLFAGTATVFAVRAVVAARGGGDVRGSLLRAGAVALTACVIVPAIGIVPAGHRGVVYNVWSGVAASERHEGVTVLVPWLQHMRVMSVRTQKVCACVGNERVFAQSKDLQEITVVASVNYRIDALKPAEIYQEVGADYGDIVIRPALYQRTKAAIGEVLAEDFAVGRSHLAVTVQEQLSAQLAGYGIIVEYVNIEDAIFDPEFITAVKAKVIAEQVAEEERRLIEAERARKEQAIQQAQGRARSVLIEAKAQSDANALLAQSLTSSLLRWRWITTWNGMLPSTLAGEGSILMVDGRKNGDELIPDYESVLPEEVTP